MEKAKRIISQAKVNVAEAKKAVANSDAAIAEAKQSMSTERTDIPQKEDNPRLSLARSAKITGRKSGTKHKNTNAKHLDFPVVGIGASAGGLEALQAFFEQITPPLKAAFVIVQHLSPDHDSFMEELLRRYTDIPVSFIEDGMKIEINHVYLIPPKVNILIRDGVLYHEPIIGRSLNLPIDNFFRSLAEDQQSNAVAIIMSGAGSDGTLGIRAIKEYGGIAMAQDPDDAKFDGMPKSALASDMVDLIRSAPELAHELTSYLLHPLFTHPKKSPCLDSDNQSQYKRILAVLKSAKKVDFSSYRGETILRRLEKRISINRFTSLRDYVDFLVKTPEEVNTLFHEILIGVTRFFRDGEAFAALERICFPELFKNIRDGALRIWVASCSTGEEAYSIAILLKDYMLRNRIVADVKIFATDIDDKSLKFAAVGFYPQNVVSDIPSQYLAKYFSPHGNGYQVNPDIRRMIIFASQDLIDNPPFFKMDLVTCRNFLIYICPEAQQRVLSSFYAGLRTDGFLFLGSSESLEELSNGFDTLARKEKIFRKHDGYTPKYSPRSPMPLHLSVLEHQPWKPDGLLSQENSELLSILEQIGNTFLPPSLVVDTNSNIIYAIRDGGSLLHMSSGRITTNLLKILPKDLSLIVSSLIRRAENREDIISSEIVLDNRPMTVRCKKIVPSGGRTAYFYIGFEESPTGKALSQRSRSGNADLSTRYQERIDELETEVHQQKESLKIAVEQLETSNEELQASNEELVASNEELQSSNEELQSVNEELYTVNIEHVRKLEEITELNYDYDNLLSNTRIGTLFLDTRLVIRKISKLASELTGIMQNDVGRPLSYFSLKKLYPRFTKDVERVNTTRTIIEKELPLSKKTYCMKIVPYLAEEGIIKGIIVSFVDLTDCKMRALNEAYASQGKARTANAQLEAAAAIARMAYFQIDLKSRKCSGSKLLPELWPLHNGKIVSLKEWIFPDDLPEANAKVDELQAGTADRILICFRSEYFGKLRHYRMSAAMETSTAGDQCIVGVIQDTTEVIHEQQRQEALERLWDESINAIPVLFYAKDADHDFRYVFANRFFLEFVGKRLEDIVGKTDEEISPAGERFHAEDQQALANRGEPVSFENEVSMPGESVHFFHTTKRQNTGVDGRRLITGIGIDVTEQRLTLLDMQAANHCLSALLESDDLQSVLHTIMKTLCERMGASHCFWMSFHHDTMTVDCEYEYAQKGRKMFGNTKGMPFSVHDEWYQCYQKGERLDIPDIAQSTEAVALLKKYCGFSRKTDFLSMYSSAFRFGKVIEGAVGYVYTKRRPEFSKERLDYLMSFSANLFRSALQRLHKQEPPAK